MESNFEIISVQVNRNNLLVTSFDMHKQIDLQDQIYIHDLVGILGGSDGFLDVTITYNVFDKELGIYTEESQIIMSGFEFFKDIFGDGLNNKQINEHDITGYKESALNAICEVLNERYYHKN